MRELTKDYIVALIEHKGLTKAEFAAKMGFARQNLDAMLNAKKKDIATVVKMAEILQIPILEFIGETSNQQKYDIHGVLYVQGTPVIVNNRAEIEKILESNPE